MTLPNDPTPPAVRPVVFAYDFPHKKTQDVILRLSALGSAPELVIAAPPVELRVPPPAIRVKPRHADLLDPADLCRELGIPYVIADHRGAECLFELDARKARIGVVAGARILPRAVIEACAHGVLNLHPGLLPDVRGLDALQWAIFQERPLGVTAHLINERVDAGWVVERRGIDEFPDDTLPDLSLRLYETQLAMLPSALQRAASVPRCELETVSGSRYNRSFPPELVPELLARFAERRARLARGEPRRHRRATDLAAD